MTTVGFKVKVHTLLSNKAEQGQAGTIKQHLSTVVLQGHMLQNKDYQRSFLIQQQLLVVREEKLTASEPG